MSPLWIVAGALAAVGVVALGVWQYRVRVVPTTEQAVAAAAAPPPDAAPLPSRDSVISDADTVGDALPRVDSLAGDPTGDSAARNAPPVVSVPPAGATPGSVPPGQVAGGVVTRPVPPRSTASYNGPWTRGVAQQWVNVRVAPSRDAAVAGVVTPNTRVQLGEVRAGWRHIRSPGVEGWADDRFFLTDSSAR